MKHIKRLTIVLILFLLVFLYFFTFKLKSINMSANENLIQFTKDGFIDSMELSNQEKLVGETDQFALYIDETTSYFWVKNKSSGEVIRSNPNVRDPRDKLVVNDDLQNLTLTMFRESYSFPLKKFDLPQTLPLGSTVTWESSDQTLITNEGQVTTPLVDTDVFLTATIKNKETAIKVFKVSLKALGNIMMSLESETEAYQEPRGLITNEAKHKQKSTLEFSYYSGSGSTITQNNYKDSIFHPETITAPEGQRTYEIKYLDDKIGFQVLYIIEDTEIDHLYFPRYMTEELYESLDDSIESIEFVKGLHNYNRDTGLYVLRNYESLTFLAKRDLYDVYYNILEGYSRERAIEENASYGYYETSDPVKFEIGVQVSLTDKGFETAVIKESIVEPAHSKIASVTLYPLLAAAVSIDEDNNKTSGYLVVPDGSGAVINFNNNKHDQRAYNKRIYAPDMSNQNIKMSEEQEKITLPVYGIIKENVGLASIVKAGASHASIFADVSERIDSYNKIYPTIHFRENYLYTLGSGWNTYSVSLWSKGMANTDLVVEHIFLDDNSYMGVAKAYQQYLVDEKGLLPTPQNQHAIATIEILGAYDTKEYLFGFPYNKIRSLTTFKQTQAIADMFLNEDYNINMLYNGAINGGLRNSIQTKVKFEGALGGKKGFNRLKNNLSEQDVDLFLQVNISQVRTFRRAFDEYTYAASRLEGSLTRDFYYHIPTQLPYSETNYPHTESDFVINPRYYDSIYNKMVKKVPTDNISFTNLGSSLVGSYTSNPVYVDETMQLSETILAKSKDKSVMLRNPLGFALPYTDYIVDSPMGTTLYSIIDYSIPLTQLVYANYINYTSRSLNLEVQRSEAYNFLKVLETGSQLKYTLTYVNPKELLNTEFTMYLSTYYEHWVDLIKEQLNELEALDLYGGHLIKHERIQPSVYKVTYSHGLELYLNYNTTAVIVDGNQIEGLSYMKGGL